VLIEIAIFLTAKHLLPLYMAIGKCLCGSSSLSSGAASFHSLFKQRKSKNNLSGSKLHLNFYRICSKKDIMNLQGNAMALIALAAKISNNAQFASYNTEKTTK
jgi:hypothetical protein